MESSPPPQQKLATRREATAKPSDSWVFTPDQLSELVHRVGHEINNPLTSVISFATIFENLVEPSSGDATAASKLRGYASAILSEAWRINNLTQQMVLLFSTKEIRCSPVNLYDATERALSRLSRQRFAGSTVGSTGSINSKLSSGRYRLGSIIIELGAISKEIAVEADPEQLEVMLLVLLENCVESVQRFTTNTTPARPQLAAERLPVVANVAIDSLTKMVQLKLVNTTLPINSKEIGRLFEPFVTEAPETKRLGIGLTVAARIAQRLGGNLTVAEITQPQTTIFETILILPAKQNSS